MTRAKMLLMMLLVKKKITDTFTREDSAILGNAETGQEWYNTNGTLGITNGVAIAKTAISGNAECYIELGASDCSVSADIKYVSGSTVTLALRGLGINTHNKISVAVKETSILLQRNINATTVTLGTSASTIPSGTTKNVRLTAIGNDITVLLDNVVILSVTDDNVLKTNTKCGMMAYKYNTVPTVTFDNFNAVEV